MIAESFRGDSTVTEEHMQTFVADIERIYPHCEDLYPDTDPGSHLRHRLPLSGLFNFLIARDINVYSFPRTPRLVRHMIGFEKINTEIDPTEPIKVQTSYQVGVDTIAGLDSEPIYTREFVITHLRKDEAHQEGWSPVPREADRYYLDPVLGVPVWHGMEMTDDEKVSLEDMLTEAQELDRLAEALRHADVKSPATDLERFNQFHGLLLNISARLGA